MNTSMFNGTCIHCQKPTQARPKLDVERQSIYCTQCGKANEFVSFSCPKCHALHQGFVPDGAQLRCTKCKRQKSKETTKTITVGVVAAACAGVLLLLVLAVDSARKLTGPQSTESLDKSSSGRELATLSPPPATTAKPTYSTPTYTQRPSPMAPRSYQPTISLPSLQIPMHVIPTAPGSDLPNVGDPGYDMLHNKPIKRTPDLPPRYKPEYPLRPSQSPQQRPQQQLQQSPTSDDFDSFRSEVRTSN